MKKHYVQNCLAKLGILHALLLLFSNTIQAQLTVINNNTASTLAQNLTGPGVSVQNASILCESNQSGLFSISSSIIGIDSGIILTTGRAASSPPFYWGVDGTEPNLANYNHGNGGDPDLTLLAGTTTHDRCILEFDFVANGDSIFFDYVFGSEEYPIFNCANYNDVFGFFISGPGYASPLNLALINGTNIPVSINSINSGVISAGGNIANCTSMGPGSPFTSLYSSNTGGTTFTYGGFTQLLKAKASIQPCSTYHLKLAIADGYDNIIDSGVFLKAGSLTSNTVQLTVNTDSTSGGVPYVFEGCDSAIIKIKRKIFQTNVNSDTITMVVSGSATFGTDYPSFQTSFIFSNSVSDSIRTIYLNPINDLINEGAETVKIYLYDNCSTPTDSITILIQDPPKFTLYNNDTSICLGKSVNINAVGDAGPTFTWSPITGVSNVNLVNPTITPSSTTTYTLTSNYGTCFPYKDSIKITVLPLPSLVVTPTNIPCYNQSNGAILATGTTTNNPLAFGINPGSSILTGSPANFANLTAGIYTITATSSVGCTKTSGVTISQPPLLNIISTGATNIPCNSGSLGTITVAATGGAGTISYTRNPGNITNTTGVFNNLNVGSYTITVKDANNCSQSVVLSITQNLGLTWVNVSKTNVFCGGANTGAINSSATGSASTISYTLSPGGITNTIGTFQNLIAGIYTIVASDANGCGATTTVTITQPANPVVITNVSKVDLMCENVYDGSISVTSTGGLTPISYLLQPNNVANSTGIFNGLSAGVYTVVVSESNGCSKTSVVTLTSPPPIVISNLAITPPTCVPGNNASVTITASGGVSPLEYRITLFSYQSSNTFTGFPYGQYTVQVKDANGCVVSSVMTVANPSPVTLANNTLIIPCSDTVTTLDVLAANGTAPYSYELNPPGITNTTGQFPNVGPGTYTVVATDANGCSKSRIVTILPPKLEWLTFTKTNLPCSGIGTGSVTMSTSGGVSPITYSISPGTTTNTTGVINGLAANTYTVTAVDVNGCSVSSVMVIGLSPAFNYSNPTIVAPNCNAASNGSISISTSGGTGSIQFTLTPGGVTNTTGTFTNLVAGIYTITGIDAAGCTATSSVIVTEPAGIIYNSIVKVPASCNPGTNGNITINATGGAGALTYKLNNGAYQVNNLFSTLTNGIYTVTTKDANGCTLSTIVNLTNPNTPFINSLTSSQVNCSGTPVSITVAVIGGVLPLTYTILPSNANNTSGIFTGLVSNTYTINVVDANACSVSSTITVQPPTTITFPIAQSTDVTCYGLGDGTITTDASGGLAPYTYQISPGGTSNTTGIFTGLSPNTYSITTTDANGCTASTNFIIAQPSVLAWASQTSTNILCNGINSGSINVSLAGGNVPYTYSINPSGLTTATGNFNYLIAGIYTITGTDSKGCEITLTKTLTQPASAITITNLNTTMPTCIPGNNGVIVVNATGGLTAYAYNLNGGTNQASSTFNNLGVSVYTVNAIDANGCIASTTVSLTNPSAPAFNNFSSTNLLCYGSNSGAINAPVVGGSGSLTYTLNPGGLSNSNGVFSSLAPNNYTISVVDGNNCSATSNVIITQPPQLIWDSVDNRDVSCYNGTNGLVTSSASGGVGTISYTLNPGGTTNISGAFFGLSTGNYTLTAVDSNGCVLNSAFAINQSPQIVWNNATISPPSCVGNTNGSFQATATGGAGSFNYKLQPSGPINTTGTFSNLISGTYTVLATDLNNCTATTTVTILPPTQVNITNASSTFASCNPGCDGSVTLTSSGGTIPYSYQINSSVFQSSNTFSALCAGAYTITVKDANGCTNSSIITISTSNGPSGINSTSIPVSCVSSSDGSLSVSLIGGVGTVNYLIQPQNISNTSGTFNSLSAIAYTVVATDASGCSISTVVNIGSPTPLIIQLSSSVNPSCFGASNGVINVGATGGTGSYTFSLSPSNLNNIVGNFTNLNSQTYTLAVSDSNSCSDSLTVTLVNPPVLVFTSTSATNVTCNGGSDGTISSLASGGTGIINYTLQPINQTNATGSFLGLANGTYTIIAADANACSVSTTISITQPSPVNFASISNTIPSCVPGGDATITMAGNGGTPGYSYNINGGTFQASGIFNNISVGVYTIQVKDANNCTASSTISITTPNSPSISNVTVTDASCNPGCDGTISVTANGGTGSLVYSINSGLFQNTSTFNSLCSNSYTLVVKDSFGCSASNTAQINTVAGPTLNSAVSNDISCFGGNNGSIALNLSGGSGVINYTLNPGSVMNTTGNFTNLVSNTYSISGSDANGCSISTVVTLNEPPQMILSNVVSNPALCNGVNNGSIAFNFTGGAGATSFALQPSGTYQAPNSFVSLAGNITYTITATDVNGCSLSTSIFVSQPPSLTIDSLSSIPVTCNGYTNGSIVMNVSGGTSPIQYSLLPGTTSNSTGIFSNLSGSIYTISASDANGCSISTSVSIVNPSAVLINNALANNITCFGLTNGSISISASGGVGQINYNLLPGGSLNTTGSFTGLSANTYTAVALDGNGCADSVALSIIEPPIVAFTNNSSTGVLCSGQNNGAINVTASGGTGILTYVIQPSGVTNTNGIFVGLAGNTSYTISATDANGCSATTAIFVVLPNAVVIDSTSFTDVTCNGFADGAISMSASGGTGTIQYNLMPGSISNTSGQFNNLSGNNYTVSATDANGCSVTSAFVIFEPTAIAITNSTSTDIICYGQINGTVSVSASGGMNPLNYTLQPSSAVNSNGQFNGLTANTYTTVVTDANGCSLSTTLIVNEPSLVKFDSLHVTDVLCFGQTNGIVHAYASGGVGTINYSILPQPSSNSTGIFNGLQTGVFTVSIVDANACSATSIATIYQPQPLVASLTSTSNVTCFGGNDGSIIVNSTGGTIPYLYNLQPVNISSSTGSYTTVTAGIYTVYVTDLKGCSDSIQNIPITEPPQIVFTSVTHQDITCYYDTSGSISVTANGGTGSIVFSLNPNIGVQTTIGNFDNLSGGNYTVTATDASGCTMTTIVFIKQNLEIVASDVLLQEPVCHGESNGLISIQAQGGVAPLTYSLNGGPFMNPGIFPDLIAGTYTITILDALGCSKDTIFNLTEPDKVHGDIEVQNIHCFGKNDGKIIAIGTGGRGDFTYYLKPNIFINKTGVFGGLGTGTFSLTIKDSSQCVFDTLLTVDMPDNPLSISFDKKNLGCYGFGNEGWAEAIVTGGTEPYSYQWNTSPIQVDARATGLRYGYHFVTVTDSYGCELKDTVYIEPGPCCDEAFLPNAFSPNGDNNNDVWRVVTAAGIELHQLAIYDRWGNKVWETYDITNGWDGTYRGKKMDVETYYYIFRYKCIEDQKEYTRKGDIILVR